MARSPIRRAMTSVEGKPAKTSVADVTFGRGANGQTVELAPAAIDHILEAGGIEHKFKAEVVELIKHALLSHREYSRSRRALTRTQEEGAGKDLERAVKRLLKVLSCPGVSRRLLAYQDRDLVRLCSEGARIPEPDRTKRTLADKLAVIEQFGTWAAEMIEKPGWPAHARPSPAKSNSARPALANLSICIVGIWHRLIESGAVKKPPTISETSPFVRFAKEIYGLVDLDTKKFETLKDRLAGC